MWKTKFYIKENSRYQGKATVENSQKELKGARGTVGPWEQNGLPKTHGPKSDR